MKYQVDSIERDTVFTKILLPNSLHHIAYLGAVDSIGKKRKFTRQQVYDLIVLGEDEFFTQIPGFKVALEAEQSQDGTQYVKTKPDASKKDNLLSLPEPIPDDYQIVK